MVIVVVLNLVLMGFLVKVLHLVVVKFLVKPKMVLQVLVMVSNVNVLLYKVLVLILEDSDSSIYPNIASVWRYSLGTGCLR